MPRLVPEMSDLQVRRLRHKNSSAGPMKAFHAVGGVAGLHLKCLPPAVGSKVGGRSWVLRTIIGGKRCDVGLGSYPEVTLSVARQRAREAKEKVRLGLDPVAERKAARSELIAGQGRSVTFEELAKEYLVKKCREFKNASQGQKLANQLKRYAYPKIGKLVVSDIDRSHIVSLLEPIWETKTETATRVRLHVERVLDLAGVKGLRKGDNPARWQGNLSLTFAARNKVTETKSHAALPVEDLPEFLKALRLREGIGARALEFIIYTAARSGEVRGARWDEIDLQTRVWTIPANRMKAGKVHRVPLSEPAMELLSSLPVLADHVFPGPSLKAGLSDVAVSKISREMAQVTPHGFRSTFKDWCRKYTDYQDEVSELQLAHVNDDKTRAAYARDELLDKRCQLMKEWAVYCLNGPARAGGNNVVAIGKANR